MQETTLSIDGKKLHDLRLARLLRREDLAERVGTHRDHIGRLEREEIASPRIKTIRMLAAALGVEPQELIKDTGIEIRPATPTAAAPTTKEQPQSTNGKREGVKTKQDKMTAFGRLIEEHRKRVGLSQTEFANAMSGFGYPGGYKQRTHSHLLYHPAVRVYPDYFPTASAVLGLSPEEEDELVRVWRSMSTLSREPIASVL